MRVYPPMPTSPKMVLATMLDSGVIDYATFLVTHLYSNRTIVEKLLSTVWDVDSRMRAAHMLFDLRDDVMPELPSDVRSVITYLALLHLSDYTINLSEICSSWAYVDLTYGGALEDFKEKPVIKSNGELTSKVRRKLYSPAWIRRYVKRGVEMVWLRHIHSRLDRYFTTVESFEDFTGGVDALQAAIIEQSTQPGEWLELGPPALAKPKDTVSRRAVVRSMRLAKSVLSDDIVREFMEGELIMLPGQSIDLALRRRASIFSVGHGACYVSAYSKTGEILADLCTYFEDTPILDQVVGFALHMSSGLEDEILTEANLVRAYPAGVRHPIVRKMLRSDQSSFQARRFQELKYLDDTKELWGGASLDFVFGSARSAMLRKVVFEGSALPRRSLRDGRPAFPLV